MMIKKIVLILCLQVVVSAQLKSNLIVINDLVDKSVSMFQLSIPVKSTIFLNYQSRLGETLFSNRIQSLLDRKGAKFVFNPNKADYFLNYNLDLAEVVYEEIIKEGFLEDFNVARRVNLNGSFRLTKANSVLISNEFNLTETDTVKYSSVKSLETPNLVFTTSEIPDEPFWSSLLEPAIAIGTIIVAILLFFTVRSN